MKPTESRLGIDKNTIVIFGAGKIGRSFIGQLFGCAGYRVVFIDADPMLVSMLNQHGKYRIVIKGETDEELIISNVSAINAFERKKVAEAVSLAGILAVSVGKNAIEKVIPSIAEGLIIRYNEYHDTPLDIILAENMRSVADFVREELRKYLPSKYPLSTSVGLIETSIGKMAPIMPVSALEKDPLVIFAEPYNTLILDGKGFRSTIPAVLGLAPKDNIKAWVDRKAFIHNLGHATAAYYGFYCHPDATYIYEVLADTKVYQFTRQVMQQSAAILRAAYPNVFTQDDLKHHIDDLIYRFRNRALQDTVFRVGQDLPRKLGSDDRFVGIIRLALQYKKPYELILKAMTYGLFFNSTDELGKPYDPDVHFLHSLSEDFTKTFIDYLKLDPENDLLIIEGIKDYYLRLTH